MSSAPVAIQLIVETIAADWPRYLQTCLAILADGPFWPIRKWEVSTLGLSGDGTPSAAVEALPEEAGKKGRPAWLEMIVGDTVTVTLQPRESARGDVFNFTLAREVGGGDTDESLAAFLDEAAQLCRGLAARAEAVWATLYPVGGGATCIPYPPLVGHNSHVTLTTEDEVAAQYDSPDIFWDSGWQSLEEFGARRLLLRGMDAAAGPEYLKRIIAQQWRLARAAKRKQTRYALPQPEPDEVGIFRAGASQLEPVGYVAAERTAEYSCALARGDSIPGWEIYELWDLLQEGKLADGRPLDIVRLVFLEAWAARQEKRPLLDIGCRVFHYEEDGELRELTE